MRKPFNNLVVFSLLILAYACQDDFCFEDTSRDVNIGFYSVIDSVATDTSFSSFYSRGMGIDKWIDSAASGGKTSLPLMPYHDTAWFLFSWSDSLESIGYADTLVLIYSRETTFISHACGFVNNYKLELAGFNKSGLIDSLRIVNPDIKGNNEQDHIEIFY